MQSKAKLLNVDQILSEAQCATDETIRSFVEKARSLLGEFYKDNYHGKGWRHKKSAPVPGQERGHCN